MTDEGYELARKRCVELLDEKVEMLKEIERLRRRLQDGSPVVEATIQHMAMEIAALKKERDELVMALHYVKNSVFEDSAAFDIAKTALAKLGADKTGEGS